MNTKHYKKRLAIILSAAFIVSAVDLQFPVNASEMISENCILSENETLPDSISVSEEGAAEVMTETSGDFIEKPVTKTET